MSLTTELQAIQSSKAAIKQALVDQGLSPSDDFSTYPGLVASLSAGGGGGGGSISWANVTTATVDSVTLAVSAYEPSPIGLHMSPDGTRLFVTGNSSNSVDKWDLSTPWDLSTATHGQTFVTGQTQLHMVSLSDGGTRLFVRAYSTGTVYAWDLSTPWDLSTAVQNAGVQNSLASQAQDMAFNQGGTRVYFSENAGSLRAYALSTPWDLSTAVADGTYGHTRTALYGMCVNEDETQIVLGCGADGVISLLDLSTAGDLTTATETSTMAVPVATGGVPSIFVPRTTGKLYIGSFDAGDVHQLSFDAGQQAGEDYSTAQIGDEIGGGIYAGIDTIDSTDYHIIAGDAASEEYGPQWKTSRTTTAGTTSTTDGLANTLAMETAGLADHPAAAHCLAYAGGGHNDWHMPAHSQLTLMYNNLTGHAEFADNVSSGDYTWSSTERSESYAWVRRLSDGHEPNYGKDYTTQRVRPCRRVPV